MTMIRAIFRKLGAGKTTILITTVAILSSEALYLFLSYTFDRFMVSGLIISTIIPSLVAPSISFFILRNVIQLDRAEEELRRAHNEMEEQTRELTSTNEQLQYEINERKAAQTEAISAKGIAETADRAKSEFLANMSHELRTPLTHIMGFTELVVEKRCGKLNETQEEYLKDVLHSSRHLLSLINDILDLSKVEAGKFELEPSDISIRELLDNSLKMVKEKAMKHRIALSMDLNGTPNVIRADERKLKQVMYNLLSNAVKFTVDGGAVRLAVKQLNPVEPDIPCQGWEGIRPDAGNLIEISVTDTGIGLKKEDIGRIFHPFEQAQHSGTRTFEGTGLGLSLSKRYIELHGGDIRAESEGKGKGSTFRFVIPIENQWGQGFGLE